MKKTIWLKKKLKLSKETLRGLSERGLQKIAAGAPSDACSKFHNNTCLTNCC